MPVWYSSIIEEHMAVRKTAGLFDVSHMGRVVVSGHSASEFLSYLLPTNCAKIHDGRAFYSNMCNETGGIIDDVIVNKFSSKEYLIVINAGNREKDLTWLHDASGDFDVKLEDISENTALLALQGPFSISLLQNLTETNLSDLRRFSFVASKIIGAKCLISRTGYTGEDGFELTIYDVTNKDNELAMQIWKELLELGREKGVLPCGLGARDSLRLEAGMCLYGHDIDETTTPIEASLENIVDLDGRNFIGRKVIESQVMQGVQRKRVAFSMLDSGIPRQGCDIIFSGNVAGKVTSGTFSPILKKGIGLAYVPPLISQITQKLAIQIRGTEKVGEIVTIPFYNTSEYGFKRKT